MPMHAYKAGGELCHALGLGKLFEQHPIQVSRGGDLSPGLYESHSFLGCIRPYLHNVHT